MRWRSMRSKGFPTRQMCDVHLKIVQKHRPKAENGRKSQTTEIRSRTYSGGNQLARIFVLGHVRTVRRHDSRTSSLGSTTRNRAHGQREDSTEKHDRRTATQEQRPSQRRDNLHVFGIHVLEEQIRGVVGSHARAMRQAQS